MISDKWTASPAVRVVMGKVRNTGGSIVDVVPALKACPFCGSNAVAVVGSFVRCGNCGAAGPFGATVEAAAEKWNERSQTPRVDTASVVDDEHDTTA